VLALWIFGIIVLEGAGKLDFLERLDGQNL
jgi:hypothetical protein